jgi:SNF2 family DNA or RNA helicase
VHTYYGLDRSLGDFREQKGLLLTSYGIWKRDATLLNTIPFELAILDEIQIAKSHTSQVHSALLELNAPTKLGLTGTPIENRLRELKSLFDIVLPTYMPSNSDYQTFFTKPIEKEHSLDRKNLLMRFIAPFILRRKKEDVLFDLPEKTEEVAHCGLSEEQRSLYQQILSQSRNHLLRELKEESSPIPYVHIFALLSYLKQICDHPAVYLKEFANYKTYESGKWDLFIELLHEARDSGQKVVVFSQYLGMLDIIESYLKEHKIGFAAIRGATKDRAEEVRRFNRDPKCEVFVGSLQAAGLGIDLTAASVVIHYDRWWNAARENQATDRVHRIGQRRGVQVFKLITKGTFEERIDKLISKKGQLMEDIIGSDEQNLVKYFNRSELIELLQDVEEARKPS